MIDKVEGSEPGASGEKLLNYTSMKKKVPLGTTGSNNGF
jgi:hypothetical protein